jgi:D-alanyl-D-alanine carboxypeptidase (penicillin-binding protein 5/6)
MVGAKTGHTDGAGWSQVAVVRRRGIEVTVALLGSPSKRARDDGLSRLLEWALGRYARVPAIDRARDYAAAEVGWGKDPIRLVAPRTIVRAVSLDAPLREQVVAPEALALPVAAGQRVGEVRVYQRGRLLAVSPLLAERSVDRPGLFGRVGWYAGRAAHHVGDLVG